MLWKDRTEHELELMEEGRTIYCATRYGRDKLRLTAKKIGKRLNIVIAPPRLHGWTVYSNVRRPRAEGEL
jgi:hypothetical protein